ncbi:MAG: 7-cyano-7-deazaguanine synthase, partial [Paramuribaculum sp.]|nr:7-cyano-7-deazaguanine synthase [Paramuribaculum sp.]
MEKDTLLIYSGGLDSTTLLWEYAPRIALAVNFSYGANQNEREAECARWQCRKAGIELIEIPLAFMKQYFRSSLLEGPD